MTYSDDPYQEFSIREAYREQRQAAALSRMEGKSVDSYGFSLVTVNHAADTAAGHGETHARGVVDQETAVDFCDDIEITKEENDAA